MAEPELPDYDSLPVDPTHPAGASWGLWGPQDELGMLNLLTPERVANAARLIQTGKVFALNWELELPNPPLFNRLHIEHEITGGSGLLHDDIYRNFNTQSSTQWDSFSHYGNFEFHTFYNGVTSADITGKQGTRNGIQAWARRGIAGRAVLLDYRRWTLSQGITYSPGESHIIKASELEAVAKAQGVEFQTGDIFIMRTGWIEWYNTLNEAERKVAAQDPPHFAGVERSEATRRFLWDRHVAAVVSDNPAFEMFPIPREERAMHETLLALWGVPIGEMFNLDALAADCAEDGRYEFFFTSAPLNKLGGVASPPNALAIK